jgi:hypothetical protein
LLVHGCGRSRVPFDHEPARVFAWELHALDERGACQSVVGNVKSSNGGMKQFGKPVRHGHRQVPDPNGILFSPDHKKLYVISTGKGPGDTRSRRQGRDLRVRWSGGMAANFAKLGVAASTVRGTLRRFEGAGLGWPLAERHERRRPGGGALRQSREQTGPSPARRAGLADGSSGAEAQATSVRRAGEAEEKRKQAAMCKKHGQKVSRVVDWMFCTRPLY